MLTTRPCSTKNTTISSVLEMLTVFPLPRPSSVVFLRSALFATILNACSRVSFIIDSGLPLNGIYDGFSEAPLILAQDQLTWVQHSYDQKEGWQNLMGTSNPIVATILYQRFSKMTRKSFIGLYLFKSWGPPYGKIKKTFKELPGAAPAKVESKHLEPERKH
jgi:hypothetical protein